MPLELPRGIRYGERVSTWGERPKIRVGNGLLGRVIDGSGQALDRVEPYCGREFRALDAAAPLPLARIPIPEPLGCGLRGLRGFLTWGRGQRVGTLGGHGGGRQTPL